MPILHFSFLYFSRYVKGVLTPHSAFSPPPPPNLSSGGTPPHLPTGWLSLSFGRLRFVFCYFRARFTAPPLSIKKRFPRWHPSPFPRGAVIMDFLSPTVTRAIRLFLREVSPPLFLRAFFCTLTARWGTLRIGAGF